MILKHCWPPYLRQRVLRRRLVAISLTSVHHRARLFCFAAVIADNRRRRRRRRRRCRRPPLAAAAVAAAAVGLRDFRLAPPSSRLNSSHFGRFS